MYIAGENLQIHNFYKGIKRDIPDILGIDNELIEEMASRIKNPKIRRKKSIYDGKYKYMNIDILDLIKNKTEYDRFHYYVKYNPDIKPFDLLSRCIKTKYYMYKGKRLISFFNSDKNKYMRALKRIRLGWSIDEAIARQDEIIPYDVAGAKGFKIMCDKHGLTKYEGVRIIHSYIK